MKPSILLCGGGGDALAAARFAFAEARAARFSRSGAERCAERVESAYRAACSAFVLHGARDGQQPALRLTLDAETLAPRFELISTAAGSTRGEPRSLRSLRVQALRAARAQRAETNDVLTGAAGG